MKRALGIILISAVAFLGLAAVVIQVRSVPSLSTIKKSFRSENLTILDRNGFVIDEIARPKVIRRLNWVSLDEVAPSFLEAVLLNEQWRISRDSITMQLAQSKFWKSIALEMSWSQNQILEAFINLSIYRGELQGISAASNALFDKSPDKLTRAQSAVLASLIRSQGKGIGAAESKACKLLREMKAGEECRLVNANHLGNLERSYKVRPFTKLAPHVARLLENDKDLREGNLVRSTLDRDLQWEVLHSFQKREISDGAAIVLENSTGHVLAYIGNSDMSPDLDFANQPRQAGLSIKPFLFAKALDERVLTANTVIEEKPEEIRLRGALSANLKLPAIRTLDQLGVDVFVQTLSELGFLNLEAPEYYGPSLALGSAYVQLSTLANAYRTLANRGVWTPMRFSPLETSEEASRRVFSEGANFIVTDLLRSSAVGEPWMALYCDSVCVGFSEKYTVAVLGSRDLWQEIMQTLHRSDSSLPPVAPQGLKESGGEWFLEGTDTESVILPKPKPGFGSRISFPIDRSTIKIDPSRPGDFAQLYFQVTAPGPDQNLYLNGKRLGRARALKSWVPVAGTHELELKNSRGQTLHKISFTIRR